MNLMIEYNRVRCPSNEGLIMRHQSIFDSEYAYLPSLSTFDVKCQ